MEEKVNLTPAKIPHKVFRFASTWWQGKIAAIRQEHIFVKILFAITVFFFLCFFIVLSYSLLGEGHPFTNDPILYSVAHNLMVCFEGGKTELNLYINKFVYFMILGFVQLPPFAPYYLLFIYVLTKVTGYNKIKGKSFIATYFIFAIILLISMFIAPYIFYNLFGWLIADNDWLTADKIFYDFTEESPFRRRSRSHCSWSYGEVAIGLGSLFIAILLSFYVIKWFYSDRKFVYKCIYFSLAVYWYFYPFFNLLYVYYGK